jgi:hypothetical protein
MMSAEIRSSPMSDAGLASPVGTTAALRSRDPWRRKLTLDPSPRVPQGSMVMRARISPPGVPSRAAGQLAPVSYLLYGPGGHAYPIARGRHVYLIGAHDYLSRRADANVCMASLSRHPIA